MNPTRLNKLKELEVSKLFQEEMKETLKRLEDRMSKEEFVKSFKQVLDIFLAMKQANEKKQKELVALAEKTINELKKVNSLELEDVKVKIKTTFAKLFDEQSNTLSFIRDKTRSIKEGKDGEDGKTPTKEELETIIKPLIPPAIEAKEKTPQEIRNALESIKEEDEKLKIEAIGNLRKELDELKARPIGKGGGGTSAMGVAQAFKYIAHTEEPVGDINGVNTTYTVKNNIWWVAGFTLNGEQIAELPNFTYASHTITFSTAIPAAYSGKDFEIKYIGT